MLTSTLVADISTKEILTGVIDLLSDWKGEKNNSESAERMLVQKNLIFYLFLCFPKENFFVYFFLYTCFIFHNSSLALIECLLITSNHLGTGATDFTISLISVAPAVTIYGKSVIKGKRNVSNTLSDKGNELQRKKI